MKKRIIVILAACMALFTVACGSSGQSESTVAPAQETGEAEMQEENTVSEEEQVLENGSIILDEDTDAEQAPEEEADDGQAEDSFSFEAFKNLDFTFSSGAGGWATVMQIHADGSFEGQYYDSDMGSTGDDYPNGTMYQSNFSGQFTQPVKVDDYTYSMQIETIDFEQKIGTEEVRDGVLYSYTDAYGLDGAQNILIYLPGKPLAELSEDFRIWIGYYDLSATADTELSFYALNNEAQEEGFIGEDIVANVKETLQWTEEYTATLEQSIENDPLSQMELNEKSQYMYDEWDYVLNQLWKVLKRTLDADRMSALTDEQRAWIAEKEQAVDDAGAECEGGSMQPMVMNLRAAEMTKERVYELMEYLE